MRLTDAVLGPVTHRWFERLVRRLPAQDEPAAESVTDADLDPLPEPARRYLRGMGVVGRPRDHSFRARFRGQFRMRPEQGFMPCDAWQLNTAPVPSRLFAMRIDLAGVVPMFGTDTYAGGRGRMHGRLLGLVTVADATGPEMDVGELVTWVNDACMLAPSMLLGPAVTWTAVTDDEFGLTVTDAGVTASARVVVDDAGRMVDFSTEDRYAALPGGLTRARWSTPIDGWLEHAGRPMPTGGRAVWHLSEGDFEYARGRFVPQTVQFSTGTVR
jgi:uncharacterized protein DUF6544